MFDITIFSAFAGGLVTFLAPCTFAALPAFLSYIFYAATGEALHEAKNKGNVRLRLFVATSFYVAGFTLVYVLLGMAASSVGRHLANHRAAYLQISGLVMVLMSLFMLFGEYFKQLHFLYRDYKIDLTSLKLERTFVLPFLIGITSAFSWVSCTGPILASILAKAGSSDAQFAGAFLLLIYSLGIATPLILIALFFGYSEKWIRRLVRYTPQIHRIAALIMLIIGFVYLFRLENQMSQSIFRLYYNLGGKTLENVVLDFEM